MAKSGSNWIWWTIGGVALLGLGVGAYIFFKDKKEKNAETQSETDVIIPPSTPSSGSSSGSTLSDTPFKNESEGNAFRGWVNDNYSDYAKSIKLERTGKFNNTTIKKEETKRGR